MQHCCEQTILAYVVVFGEKELISTEKLTTCINLNLSKGRIDDSLTKIHDLVNRIITEPICTANVYASLCLDDLCTQIGRASLELCSYPNDLKYSTEFFDETVVFIVSRLQSSGGHTRVIEDLLRILPHKRKYIFITDWVGRSDSFYVENTFGDQELSCLIEYAPKVTPAKRLLWLQNRLIEARARDVYLFNHHEDSIAVASMEACRGANIHFFHHGDHHLCLGVHLKDVNHIDFHAFGFKKCRNELKVENNSYLPLVVKDHGARGVHEPFIAEGRLTTCTAAGWNKLGVRHSVSYIDVVPALLAQTGGRHIHIGNLPFWVRWRMHRKMLKLNVDPASFVYISRVSSVWQSLKEMGVDVYISSFPVTGGRTMVEVMGAGIPVAVYNHPTSRFLGGIDMAYPEAFCWRKIDDLISICSDATHEVLLEHSANARHHYLKYHHPDLLKKALLEQRGCIPPPSRDMVYVPDELQVASNIARCLTFWAIVHKCLYRMFKKVRSRASKWI